MPTIFNQAAKGAYSLIRRWAQPTLLRGPPDVMGKAAF